jgi:hypothetical protein
VTTSLIKSYRAGTETAGDRIVAFTGTGAEVAAAASATAPSIGVSTPLGADAGGMLDVALSGLAELRLGGPVDAGDPLTADADGKGVVAAPVAGSVIRYAAIALDEGVENDIIPVLVVPGIINTPA